MQVVLVFGSHVIAKCQAQLSEEYRPKQLENGLPTGSVIELRHYTTHH